MSEKINELIKSVKDLKYDSSTGTFETDRRALFEFAELIVQECAQVAHNTQYKHSPAHTVGDCATAIKEHFGVGMSTEDKKTLIKELLGVKND
ncbi:MAG: hypothetical protein EBT95_10180 [Verrucomicrobia bacterium]|jgi:hypothetical protein|nr:hypothetical protein [Verrucomicrobiota bacterium]